MTSAELHARRKEVERDAALALGHMLFEFSRLDVNLGLCLASLDGGACFERRTREAEGMTLHAKLDELARQVAARLPLESEQHSAYATWIKRAHALRQHRNELVHGRWGIDVAKGKAVNVLGLPTSPSQQINEYTIEELGAVNDDLLRLQAELGELRANWPL